MNPPQSMRSATTLSMADLALGAGLLVVAVLSGIFVDSARPDTVEPSTWWHWVLLTVPSLMVTIRRVIPVGAVVVATSAQALIWVSDLPEFLLAIVVVLYSASADGGKVGIRFAAAATAVLTAITVVGLTAADDVSVYQVPLVALSGTTAIALGANSARQRERAAELATEVANAKVQAEHDRRAAIADERIAIARELHDIIGHTLATIAVRAEAGSRVAASKPDEAVAAITAIASTARASLDETRQVLAGLRSAEVADLSPAPDLEAVRALVANFGASGADVTLEEDACDQAGLPAVLWGGVYRIVQESLTNAVKHGGPEAAITVRLIGSAAGLAITIENSTRTGSEASTLGDGLSGMAERAKVLGGTFDTFQDKTRYVVKAFIPYQPGSDQ